MRFQRREINKRFTLPEGARYQIAFSFEEVLNCNTPNHAPMVRQNRAENQLLCKADKGVSLADLIDELLGKEVKRSKRRRKKK